MNIIQSFKVFCQCEYKEQTTNGEVNIRQENNGSLYGILPINSIKNDDMSVSIKGLPNSDSQAYDYFLEASTGRINNELFNLINGLKVTFHQLEIRSQKLVNPDENVYLRFYLTNLPFFQDSNQEYNIKILNYNLKFSKFLEGCVSTVVEIDNIKYSDKEEVEKLIHNICWICSFAGEVSSFISRLEAYHNNDKVYIKLNNCEERNKLNSGSQIIDDADICKFIQNSYQYYKQHQQKYLLNNLIDIFIFSQNTICFQVKILLMSNFLEIIRYNYAVNVAIPRRSIYIGEYDLFYWSSNDKKASFQAILKDFCNTHNISNWHEDFMEIRNEIVHTGDVSNDKANRYRKLENFCIKVILALLNWDQVAGEYTPKGKLTKVPFQR